jgi:hypothetical protein
MSEEQEKQFNIMFLALERIAEGYQAPDELRENCDEDYGFGFEETIEMSYENIQREAATAIKGVGLIQR